MTEKVQASYHLVLEGEKPEVKGLALELAKIPTTNVWVIGEGKIRVGILPKLFKAIPLQTITYTDGWLVIDTKETHLTTQVFVICNPEAKPEIDKILDRAKATWPSLRVVVEK